MRIISLSSTTSAPRVPTWLASPQLIAYGRSQSNRYLNLPFQWTCQEGHDRLVWERSCLWVNYACIDSHFMTKGQDRRVLRLLTPD